MTGQTLRAPQTMRPGDWAALALLSLLWGGSFMFNGIAVRDLPPFTIVAGRVAIAAAILVTILRLTGHRLPADVRTWRDFMVLAFLGNVVPFSLITWGQGHIPSGLAAILNATTPLFTVLLLRLTGAERVGLGRAGGLVLGMVGVAVLMGPKALDGATFGLLGAAAILLASSSYAVSGLWARRFKDTPVLVTAACSLTASSVQAVPLALVVDRPWTLDPGADALLAVLALAVFSSAVAYMLFYRIMGRAGPANASLVTFLVPATAILLGAWVLGERLPWTAFAGLGLILLSLAAIDGRVFKHLARPRLAAAE